MKGSGWARKSLFPSTRRLSLYCNRRAVASACCHNNGEPVKWRIALPRAETTPAEWMSAVLGCFASAGAPTPALKTRPDRKGRKPGVSYASGDPDPLARCEVSFNLLRELSQVGEYPTTEPLILTRARSMD